MLALLLCNSCGRLSPRECMRLRHEGKNKEERNKNKNGESDLNSTRSPPSRRTAINFHKPKIQST